MLTIVRPAYALEADQERTLAILGDMYERVGQRDDNWD